MRGFFNRSVCISVLVMLRLSERRIASAVFGSIRENRSGGKRFSPGRGQPHGHAALGPAWLESESNREVPQVLSNSPPGAVLPTVAYAYISLQLYDCNLDCALF